MKRLFVKAVGFVMLVFCFNQVNAQIFKYKDKVVNVGIGFGGSYYNYAYYTMSFPLLSASLEYCIKDGVGPGAIGLGGYLGFTGSHYETSYYSNSVLHAAFGFRGAYHLTDLAENLDLYSGLGLGFVTAFGSHSGGGYTNASFFLGSRYYLTPKVALMAELGWGFYNLNLGMAFKLK